MERKYEGRGIAGRLARLAVAGLTSLASFAYSPKSDAANIVVKTVPVDTYIQRSDTNQHRMDVRLNTTQFPSKEFGAANWVID